MRYQLPPGVASVSVQGMSFVGDDDDQITVPDGLPPEVYSDLESPHHHNLKGIAEPVHARDAEVAGDPLAEKRLLRELLRMHGVVLDGRATLPYLRELVVNTLDEREPSAGSAPALSEPPSDDATGAGGRDAPGAKKGGAPGRKSKPRPDTPDAEAATLTFDPHGLVIEPETPPIANEIAAGAITTDTPKAE